MPLIVWSLLISLSASLFAEDTWPQWRGVQRTGEVQGDAWPNTLDGIKEQWSVSLDAGYPGPIVSEDMVFTVETRNKKEEVVRAFDRETGKEIWSCNWAGSLKVPFFASANGSWVRSTPAYSDGMLFVGGIQDVLVALEAGTGKERWRVDFKERHDTPAPSFGMVCSPLIDGEFLYVQAGGGLCKLRKDTGAEVWRGMTDGGGMFGSAFSSPVIATIADKKMILVQTRTMLAGVDPETGKPLWAKKIEAFRGMNILTPTVQDDWVFTSSYGGGSFLLGIEENEGTLSSTFRWKTPVQGYMSSPIVIDGHVYLHLRNERFTCLELLTGDKKWTSPKAIGKYMSLASQGSKILGLDERGTLHLIDANPNEWTEIGTHKVSDQETWGHLSIAGNQIFVRELKGLKAFTWE